MKERIQIPYRPSWVTILTAIAFVGVSSSAGVALTLVYRNTIVSLCLGAVLFPLCYLGARKIWIGVGIISELREQGLHGVVAEAAQVFRKTMRAAHRDEPMPEPDAHLRPGGSLVVAMYTIAAALHGFVLAFMSGQPSMLKAAVFFGAAGFVLGCVLYVLVRSGFIDLWQSSEDPLLESETRAERKQTRRRT